MYHYNCNNRSGPCGGSKHNLCVVSAGVHVFRCYVVTLVLIYTCLSRHLIKINKIKMTRLRNSY